MNIYQSSSRLAIKHSLAAAAPCFFASRRTRKSRPHCRPFPQFDHFPSLPQAAADRGAPDPSANSGMVAWEHEPLLSFREATICFSLLINYSTRRMNMPMWQ